jgi:hypothetical protein
MDHILAPGDKGECTVYGSGEDRKRTGQWCDHAGVTDVRTGAVKPEEWQTLALK